MIFFRCAAAVLCFLLFAAQPAPSRAASSQGTFIVDLACAPKPIDGHADLLFCVDYQLGILYRVDPETGQSSVVLDGLQAPHGIAIYQNDNGSIADAYVAELDANRVIRVDLRTGFKTTVAENMHSPARLAIKEKDGAIEAIYVTQLYRGSVARLTPDGQLPWPYEVMARGILFADGIMLEQGGETALVSSFNVPGPVTRIDTASGRRKGRLHLGLLWAPAQFAGPLAAGAGSIFFLSEMYSKRVTQVNCTADGTCKAVKRFQPLESPLGIALSSDGSRLFAAEAYSGRIVSIDAATGAITTIAQLPQTEAALAPAAGN